MPGGSKGRKGDHCPQAFYHSFRLPVRHGWVRLNGGAFPQQIGADRGDTCEAAGISGDPGCPFKLLRDPDGHTHLAGVC